MDDYAGEALVALLEESYRRRTTEARRDARALARERRFAEARLQPVFPLVAFDMDDLLARVRSEHFPKLRHEVRWSFHLQPTLAFITYDAWVADIRIHEVMNHPDTPEAVMSATLKHELLHLVVSPREVGGEMTHHPPEFWEREREITTAHERAHDAKWRARLHDLLKALPKDEGVDVRAGWKREMWGEPRVWWDEGGRVHFTRERRHGGWAPERLR